MKSIIGGRNTEELETLELDKDVTHKTNRQFWDTVGSEFLGVTALPHYGAFVTEEKLHLLDNTKDKSVLEIGCGNGYSLEYISKKEASELWGIDLSQMQINRTKEFLLSRGIDAKLLCAPMENECGLPNDYFDEAWYSDLLAGENIILSNRKLSTYINSLSKSGFVIEQLVEESDEDMIKAIGKNEFAHKAQMLPVTFVIKARKL